jgi:hypothetical protein
MSGREPIVICRGTPLERTPEGTRCMSARDVAPWMRGVLSLFKGVVTFGEILEKAGAQGGEMAETVLELLDAGLVRVIETEGTAQESSRASAITPQAVARAKIELLRRLEASGSFDAVLLADDLLEARTLKDLAERSRTITLRLRESDGDKVAGPFWNDAKQILIRWRDGGHGDGR